MLFLLAVILFFTLPGHYLLMQVDTNTNVWEKLTFGTIVGFVLFTLVCYLLIILNFHVFSFLIFLTLDLFIYKKVFKSVRKVTYPKAKYLVLLFFIFITGILGQLAIISPSGRFLNEDLIFWSSHAHDASWHIALSNEINNGWPFQNPVFAGEKLVNYHFFSDIPLALFSKYLKISVLDLYFRYFPFLFSLLLGSSVYLLTFRMTQKRSASLWAVIFTYFAGSFGYVIGKGESIFWATQIQSASGNPPQIISDFLVAAILYFVHLYLKKRDKIILVILILLLSSLIEFKVYASIVLTGGLFLIGLWQIAIPSAFFGLLLYLPNSHGSGSFLIFQPWWYIRTMIVEPSRLNWLDLELRRQTYLSEHNWKRVISIELMGFLIFIVGNLGMRFMALWDVIHNLKSYLTNRFNLLLLLLISISLFLPLLFLQKGVASNTAQFLQYYLLVAGIIAGICTDKILANIKLPIFYSLASIVIIVLMIPTQINLLKEFYGTLKNPRLPFTKISANELEALHFIKTYTAKNIVILTPPYNQYTSTNAKVPPIWDWFDTSYVAAFSNRRTYLDDYEQVDIMGYDYKSRLDIKKTIFESNNIEEVKGDLEKSGAKLIYFPVTLKPKIDLSLAEFKVIFTNSEVEVWQKN